MWAFTNKAEEADEEAPPIRAIAPTAGSVLREMEQIDRMLQEGWDQNILIDPSFPEALPMPAPPPSLDDLATN